MLNIKVWKGVVMTGSRSDGPPPTSVHEPRWRPVPHLPSGHRVASGTSSGHLGHLARPSSKHRPAVGLWLSGGSCTAPAALAAGWHGGEGGGPGRPGREGARRTWQLGPSPPQLCVHDNYRNNPFHNFRHCFCVTQMMYSMIWLCRLQVGLWGAPPGGGAVPHPETQPPVQAPPPSWEDSPPHPAGGTHPADPTPESGQVPPTPRTPRAAAGELPPAGITSLLPRSDPSSPHPHPLPPSVSSRRNFPKWTS